MPYIYSPIIPAPGIDKKIELAEKTTRRKGTAND
jgi:hypothetical protein